ncbi:MAG: endonuclease [Flavobacteriaceae bacterium]|nr:endonuclease [Flavobacteriaceae bacterium]
MKKLLLYFLLIFSISVFSQIPSYYNDVNLTLTGTALKNALATKITTTHTTYISYTPGVWDALKQTDLDPTDNTKVVLIYGWDDTDSDITNDRTRDKDLHGSGSGVWNREHVYPKSLGIPNLGTTGVGADAHNLRPADAQRNSSRSNRKFGAGSGNSGATVTGDWYPGDEWKGDVARILMYMYLHYGNQTLPTNVVVGTVNISDPNMIDLLLQWNAEDPVSDLEKQRNPVLEIIQGNRNPFIDNPSFATKIWGGPQAEDLFSGSSSDTQAPTAPTNLTASNTTQTSTSLAWTASTDNVAVTGYDVFNGSNFVTTTTNTNYTVTGLSSNTAYSFTVKAKDAAGNTSANSNTVNVTTLQGSGGGTTTELLISEYVEGSSYNKALEIANFTGTSVDLSIYKIKKQTNGAGSWSGGYTLTGTLANGSVFVVSHSSASSAVTSVANATTSSSELNFNGNDAIGLFKNDVLIDAVGVFNSTDTFGANKTLQRKSTITSPNTNYTVSEWNSLASDTFSGLGNHTIDGGNPTDTEVPTAPSNLTSTNITETSVNLNWNASTDNTAVTGYDIYQGASVIATTTNTSYSVSGLNVVTSYTFSIKAKDAAGNISNASNTVNITTVDTTAPSAPTNLTSSNITQTTVDLSWTAASDNVSVTGYDIYQGASLLASTSSTNYNVSGLTASTSYTFSIKAKDAAGNTSNASNSINVTTDNTPATGTASDLIISEYVEGSSNNKALEIANFTGSTVDLSNYSLKKATNGSGSFSTTMSLSGNLANGQVYVIVNSSANATLQALANTTNGTVLTFNGNDAVGLFKNNILIDLLGNASSSSNFAQDVTLRRKSSVNSPNTTYTVAEWDSFSQDTFSGLGNHTLDGAADVTAPSAPTSLTASNVTQTTVDLTWNTSTDNVAVTGYEVYNGATKIVTITNTNYQVTGLTPNTSYNFSVTAIDAASNTSSASNVISTTTLSNTSSTVVSQSYFESGWDNWADGGSDADRYSGSRSYEGSYSIRLRDNSGTASAMTSQSYDLSSFDTVEIEFYFYAYSMESGEDFWVRFYDGSSWSTVETYASGTDFNNNGFYSATVILNKNNHTFANNSQIRFQNDASGNADHIYIDRVTITGKTGTLQSKGKTSNSVELIRTMLSNEADGINEFSIYPNPVTSSVLTIKMDALHAKNYKIVNTIGQIVLKGKLTSNQINVSQLKKGIYFLEITTPEEKMIQRFVKN